MKRTIAVLLGACGLLSGQEFFLTIKEIKTMTSIEKRQARLTEESRKFGESVCASRNIPVSLCHINPVLPTVTRLVQGPIPAPPAPAPAHPSENGVVTHESCH
jgi:hypothetical protein